MVSVLLTAHAKRFSVSDAVFLSTISLQRPVSFPCVIVEVAVTFNIQAVIWPVVSVLHSLPDSIGNRYQSCHKWSACQTTLKNIYSPFLNTYK